MPVAKTMIIGSMLLMLLSSTPVDFNPGPWPTLHHDAHNSDATPQFLGSFKGLKDLKEIGWVLREEGHPSVVLTTVMMASLGGRDYAFITTGKNEYPNLTCFDLQTGEELWHAAPATAELDPGPEACAMTGSVVVDNAGNIYVSDCHYIFCYRYNGTLNAEGNMPYKWRVPMPGLRKYDPTDTLWHDYDDPSQDGTMAKPFITMFLTRPETGKTYLGGIDTIGGIFILDPEDGSLYAETHLMNPLPGEALDLGAEGPCDPIDYTLKDNPMYYSLSPDAEDGMSPFGVWCTGVQPQTDDPDADYFMNPCQIKAYLEGNTAGVGSMIVNTPATVLHPDNPNVTRIYAVGAQSEYLAQFDDTPTEEDAVVYRIDFDHTAAPGERLTVMNYQDTCNGLCYRGRMPQGVNSAASATVSENGKWLVTADNNDRFYCFSTDTGELMWAEEIGTLLGSPTLVQRVENDGRYYAYAWGDSKVWVFGFNPETGANEFTKAYNIKQYVLTNNWRDDNPAYDRNYLTPQGKPYEREAVGASIIVATDDHLIVSYSMGWVDPDLPQALLIPTHNVLVFIDRLALADPTATPKDVVEAAYNDTHGTVEQAAIFSKTGGTVRGWIPYASQSPTAARFMEVNDMMSEPLKKLYMRPYGGVRIVEPVF